MIDSITTFNLTDVLADEPQLQPILDKLAEQVSSFHVADGSLLGDLYTENLDDALNLPVLRVKDSAMTNSVAIKALLASLKLINNQTTTTSQ